MLREQITLLAGLDSKDIKILQSLARLKIPSLAADIQKHSGLPRSSVVYKLRKLFEKKLISKNLQGKREYWFGIPENQILQAVNSNDKLEDKYPFQIYSGVNEIISLWYRMVNQPKNTRFTVIQPHRSFAMVLKKTPAKVAIDVSERIKKNAFIIDAIEQEKAANVIATVYKNSKTTKRLARAFMDRLEDMVKVPDDFLDEKSEVYMFKNHVVFIDWETETAIDIHNTNIYHLMLSMFEKTKAYGSRYQLGKYVEHLMSKETTPPGTPQSHLS